MSGPNIVYILADDLGYGDLGCFGNEIVRTPRIDALAEEGVTLTQHYSASPLCAPARAALLTGRYNHRTGAVDVPSNRGLDRIALDETTIADLFSRSGYATGMVGKWHNGLHDIRHHPNARGFGEFAGFLNGGMDYYQWVLDRNGSPEPSDGRYLTDVFTDEAIGFIRRHRSEPFLLFLTYNAPHLPYQAPESLIRGYRDVEGLSDDVRTIYAMIEAMDTGVGRVVDELSVLGLSENTIVVFTSDNGAWLGGESNRYNGPFRGQKGDVLEGGIRVPGILRYPAQCDAGGRCDRLVHFCDWLPTLAGLCGIDSGELIDKDLNGSDVSEYFNRTDPDSHPQSVSPTADEKRWFWQRNRYAPVGRCNGAMREGPWKLYFAMRDGADWKDPGDNASYREGMTAPHRIRPLDRGLPERPVGERPEPELYRIDTDPGETHDLASEYPERIETMTARWDRWFGEIVTEWRPAFAANTREHDDG